MSGEGLSGRISLVFCRGSTLVDTLIRAYDHGYWSHVDVLTNEGRRLGAQNAVYQGVPAGVQIRWPGYTQFADERQVDIAVTADQVRYFFNFLNGQLGKPYDTTGLVRNFVGAVVEGAPAPALSDRDWRQPDSWWCSELAGAALEAAGVFRWPLGTPCNLLTPDGLFLAVSAIADVHVGGAP